MLGEELNLAGGKLWRIWPNLSPSFKRYDQAWRTLYANALKYYKIKETEVKKLKPWDNKDQRDTSVLTNMYQGCRGSPDLESVPFNVILESTVAGHVTSTTVVGYFLLHMALNPDKQQAVYEEIMREIGDDPITPEGLNRLQYFNGCTKESQRLNPPFLGVSREIQSPTVIGGYQIPPGTQVMLNQVTLNQMHVESPTEFVPERFIRDSDHPLADSVPNFGHLIFGYGRRQCPGRRISNVYSDVLKIKMLKEFKIQYPDQQADSQFKLNAGLLQ